MQLLVGIEVAELLLALLEALVEPDDRFADRELSGLPWTIGLGSPSAAIRTVTEGSTPARE